MKWIPCSHRHTVSKYDRSHFNTWLLPDPSKPCAERHGGLCDASTLTVSRRAFAAGRRSTSPTTTSNAAAAAAAADRSTAATTTTSSSHSLPPKPPPPTQTIARGGNNVAAKSKQMPTARGRTAADLRNQQLLPAAVDSGGLKANQSSWAVNHGKVRSSIGCGHCGGKCFTWTENSI